MQADRLDDDREDSHFALQETFFEVCKSIGRYREEGSLWGWIRTIAASKALMRLRRNKYRDTDELHEEVVGDDEARAAGAERTRTTTANVGVRFEPLPAFSVDPSIRLRRSTDDFILFRDEPARYRNQHSTLQAGGEIIARYATDPDCFKIANARWFTEASDAQALVQHGIRRHRREAVAPRHAGVRGGSPALEAQLLSLLLYPIMDVHQGERVMFGAVALIVVPLAVLVVSRSASSNWIANGPPSPSRTPMRR